MAEIRKFLTITTAHLTKETADWLGSIDLKTEGPSGGATPYGWFLYVHEDNICQDAPGGEFPPDLWAIFEAARKHGVEYVMLDCDAELLDGLPSYDW